MIAVRSAATAAPQWFAGEPKQLAHPSASLPSTCHLSISIRLILTLPTASVDLSWSPYAGARFPLYLVRRRTQSLSAITITQSVDVADTTYTDQNLRGNEPYEVERISDGWPSPRETGSR